jgi:hypothetical protein
MASLSRISTSAAAPSEMLELVAAVIQVAELVEHPLLLQELKLLLLHLLLAVVVLVLAWVVQLEQ